MPNIPVYGDYRTRLADAPNVRQDLQTDASMFGGNQARAFGAWASSLKGASEIVKSIGGMVGAGQAGGGGLGGIPVADSAGAGGTVQPGIDMFPHPQEPPTEWGEWRELDRKAFSVLDAGPAPSAPEPQPIAAPKAQPAPEQQADLGAVFVRPPHTPESLIEYRESQNDLADTMRGWRSAVGRGEMNAEDVRDLLRDEIRGHTRSMKTAEAVRALTDWGERQIAAIAANEGSPENRLAAAANRRLDRRAEDVVQAGGDLKVLAGQLARATRDVWEDGEALGLPAERIDANVRRARDTLSATAVLAAAGRDRELGARTLAVLRDKNMISDSAAEPLDQILTANHRPGDPEDHLVPAGAGGGQEIATGSAGSDTLQGGAGNDVLDGGARQQVAEPASQEDAAATRPTPPLAASDGTVNQSPPPTEQRSLADRAADKADEVLRGILGPAYEPIKGLFGLLSPGADVRDMVEGSGEVAKGAAGLDTRRTAEGAAQMAGGMMGIFTPGSYSEARVAAKAGLGAATDAAEGLRHHHAPEGPREGGATAEGPASKPGAKPVAEAGEPFDMAVKDRNAIVRDPDGTLTTFNSHRKDAIRELAEGLQPGRDSASRSERVWYGVVPEAQAARLAEDVAPLMNITDADFKNIARAIHSEEAAHALREHGGDKIPLKAEDFEHFPDVVETGELVSVGTRGGVPKILFRKKVEGNWLYVAEEVRGGAGSRKITMNFKTAYWNPGPSR